MVVGIFQLELVVDREKKLGLESSDVCALLFEDAELLLVNEPRSNCHKVQVISG